MILNRNETDVTQILNKFQTNIEQILNKYQTNITQIHCWSSVLVSIVPIEDKRHMEEGASEYPTRFPPVSFVFVKQVLNTY